MTMFTPLQQPFLIRQKKKGLGLNLVALMDIFTVLVFFLLFNVHEEQSIVMGKHVSNLPLSTQAMDLLNKDNNIKVLEVESMSHVYFEEQQVDVIHGLKKVEEVLLQYCENMDEELSCHRLAIEAPPELPYSFINQFIELGRDVGFKNVYLVVAQK